MGHQRQYKRQERNLDDFLVIPVPAPPTESTDDGGEADEDEQDEQDTITEPGDFQHFLDLLFHVLNGGDLTPPIIFAPQSESDESDPGKGGEGSKSDDEQADDDAEEGTDADGDDAGNEYADDEVETSDEGGATGEHKNTGVRDDLDYKPETADEADDDGRRGTDRRHAPRGDRRG